MGLVDRGDELLRDGNPEEAKALYQQALELDGHSERARQQLQSAQSRISENAFNLAMSLRLPVAGTGELCAGAGGVFQGAEAENPARVDARSGVEQAQHRITAEKINGLLKQAETAEQNEDWQEAASAYEAALKLDGNLGNAREGKRRAALRNEIHNKLEQAIAQPERLFDRGVYNQTAAFRDKIRALSEPGPVLSGQLAKTQPVTGPWRTRR